MLAQLPHENAAFKNVFNRFEAPDSGVHSIGTLVEVHGVVDSDDDEDSESNGDGPSPEQPTERRKVRASASGKMLLAAALSP